MTRQTVRVQVLDIQIPYDIPDTLAELLADIQAAYDSVPDQYKSTAECEGDYDRPGWINAWYERPETDDEMAEREAKLKQRQLDNEAKERALYQRLRRKFD